MSRFIGSFLFAFVWLCLACNAGGRDARNRRFNTPYAVADYGSPLFLIMANDKYGFINEAGKVVIKPVYRDADDFSEGLAAVRRDGTFGYINTKGDVAIPFKYDFARAFHEGLAIVYLDGKSMVIDRKGKKVAGNGYREIGNYEQGHAFVMAASGQMGIIDREGRILIDTIFSIISSFHNGLARVELKGKDEPRDNQCAIIDTNGRYVVKPDVYSSIYDYDDGYYRVSFRPDDKAKELVESKTGFLNDEAKLVFTQMSDRGSYLNAGPYCGLIIKTVTRPAVLADTKEVVYNTRNSYPTYIDLSGKVVAADTNWTEANNFSCNRAFVRTNKGKYLLINNMGKVIVDTGYEGLNSNGFKDGLAVVETDAGWGVIDTNGRVVIEPVYYELSDESGSRNCLFYKLEDDASDKYGVLAMDGTVIAKPMLEGYDRRGHVNGLLRCVTDSVLTYINRKGSVVWQGEKPKKTETEALNMAVMTRGYFYASSRPDPDDLGGHGSSENGSKKIGVGAGFAANKLSVVVNTDLITDFYDQCKGVKVKIANNSDTDMQFDASDSRLYMKVQAKDKHGQWKDIEYLPSSWCGNSYHKLTLEKGRYWEFVTPIYDGEFRTMLRVRLEYLDPMAKEDSRNDTRIIYSNEYSGSVNPGQFWRQAGHVSGGLMDPYND